MATLDVTIQPLGKGRRKIRIEIDVEKFERLASNLGLFSPAFLKSLEPAERDYRKKRMKSISFLRELRVRNDRSEPKVTE
jgi:hypothetical protein